MADMSLETAQPMLSATDHHWFGEQTELLLPELFGVAMRLCRDRTDAEDLVASAIAKAWEALPSLEERASFRAWIFRIMSNLFASQCRSARSRMPHDSFDESDDADFSLFDRLHQPVLLWWGNPETEFLNRLLREDLERAIDALADPYRAVVVMVDVQGLTYHEVATLLDVPIGTVRSRLARGRSRLQAMLWKHAQEAGLTGAEPPDERRENANDH